MPDPIDYVELPGGDLVATKTFYEAAFGWSFTDYGPDYTAIGDAGLDGGFASPNTSALTMPLVILRTDDLEAAVSRVEGAGGVVTVPIFEFPGGRRFHFRDPAGNELAVWAE
jgi:uncharacterized protein